METPIRTTRRATEADEWALVLTAAGIPYRLEQAEDGWTLLVPDPEVSNGHAALDAYEAARTAASGPGRERLRPQRVGDRSGRRRVAARLLRRDRSSGRPVAVVRARSGRVEPHARRRAVAGRDGVDPPRRRGSRGR